MRPEMKLWMMAILVAALAGCASVELPATQAERLIREGRYEEGLELLKNAAEKSPESSRARADYIRRRELVTQQLLAQADNARVNGEIALAESLYRRAEGIDPASPRAASGLELVRREARYLPHIAEAEKLLKEGELDAAEARLRTVLSEEPGHRAALLVARSVAEERVRRSLAVPTLAAAAKKPVSLEFRDVALRSIFEVLTRSANINFVFDRDVRQDQRATIFVKDTPIERVIDMLLATNGLAKKVIDERTVIVYPSTPQKRREYEELVVRSFYLVNADPKQTANLIRTILKTRDIFIDEKLGLLVMRDTPDAVRLAEKLVTAQDLAEPEVVLHVEVLEVARSKLLDLGVRWPDQVSFSLVGAAGTPGELTLPEWLNRSSELVRINVTNPLFIINMRQQDGDTNLLANPRIRVKNREKAKVHIGDRVPVITSTGTTGGFVSQSVNYLDVGLKLDVEASVALVNEVSIKIGLEVSSILDEISISGSGGDTLAYRLGTRNATTVLRLKDGETQILAGLISDDDRRTANRVPGLGDIPVLGALFSSKSTDHVKSEIVLLITPHVVRGLTRPDAVITEFGAGTEAAIGTAGGVFVPIPSFQQPQVQPPPTPPAMQPPPVPGAAPAPGAAPGTQREPAPTTPPGLIPPEPVTAPK